MDEHATHQVFSPLAGELQPRSLDEAYDVQDAVVALRKARDGGRVGYKIALTTPAMRKFVGHDDSIAGQVLASTVRHSPATVRAADAGRLGFECELAFLIGADTDPAAPPADRAAIARHIGAICPAFELIDDRGADYARFAADRSTPLSLAADNAWNHGVVLGEWRHDWADLDTAALRGAASINNLAAGEGHGRDVLGHPLDAMLWIARHLHARGAGLKRGEFVITGSLITSKFPVAGDLVRFAVEGVGEVRMSVE